MKAQLQIKPELNVELETETAADMFEELASIQEVFGEKQCGVCKCTDIRFLVRQDDEENKYYELLCCNSTCRARLPFGQKKKPKGVLYPKKRWNSLSPSEQEKRGPEPRFGVLPDGGWYKWRPAVDKGSSDEVLDMSTKGDVPF